MTLANGNTVSIVDVLASSSNGATKRRSDRKFLRLHMAVISILTLILVQLLVENTYSSPCRGTVEGDIMVDGQASSRTSRRHVRAAIALEWKLWSNRTVPFVIDRGFDDNTVRVIRQAMKHWQDNTCIRFVQRTNERDYIHLKNNGSECCSMVGRVRGGQDIFLGGRGCWTFGIVLHELGHAIGFWHEQSRPDRDEYLEVLNENILKAYRYNYIKKSRAQVDSMDQPYDYKSIMQYGIMFFSVNRRRTMRLKVEPHMEKYLAANYGATGATKGQQILSDQDIIQTNLLYKCAYSSDKVAILVASEGRITSPGYPRPYPGARDFTWIVSTQSQPNQILTAVFEEFSVGEEDAQGRCTGDYLEVRKGKGSLSPFLARFCGARIPDVISVFGDSLYFRLHATSRNTGVRNIRRRDASQEQPRWKFALRYKTSDCGQRLKDPLGYIQSPGYPRAYPAGKDCVWQINAPSGFRIKVQFHVFHFREVDSSRGCLDFLEMREGDQPLSKFTGRYCGRNNPGVRVLRTDKLRLSLHSDEVQSARPPGFRMRYQFIDIDECAEQKTLCEHGCANYPGGFACGCRAGFKFVEKESNNGERHCLDIDECESDNGGCSTGCTNTEGSYFCGPCPHGYYLDEDKKTCKDSDECQLSVCQQECTNSPGGFECWCRVGFVLGLDKRSCFAIPFCTGTLTAAVGRFTSPLIPSWYSGAVDCQWTIRVRDKYTIGMYMWLNWSRDERCRNYVEITLEEGRGRYSLQLCGQQDVEGLGVTHFKSHQLTVRYHAEPPYSDGFRISYHMRPKKEELCGGVLHRSSGVVQTPGYPSLYPNKAKCLWKITSPDGKKVILQFESFDLESQTSCKYDFIDIQEKDSSSSEVKPVGRFCGNKRPPVITTTSNELLITFQSDGTVQKTGFRAKYYAS